ncbi:PD-(D/E)XK motif protein [Micromonospora sp. NIE79]|uniref:PD-(D/E)XK motif protein n=1 Tax=Micromonospora trifolii TaxID=2911208 RepID=A0ABS9N847_9ACTN|nr:PD-(D/E)XK motif protein [Micromonospora trifolii]MCG5446137.1 PD-(D/E)XK motif protein [Micromonospora trifolii]
MTSPDRHLSGEGFAAYVATGVPMEHPVDGTPRVILFTDPANHRIGLRGPARGNETPAPTGLEHVSTTLVHDGANRLIEIAVHDPRLFADAYPVLCGVADRAQLDGLPLSAALLETLRHIGHLIRPEDTLTREVETGLIGELCLVAGLAATISPDAAIAAWRGGTEEHDFGLPDVDVEVKTTAGERRIHRISSVGQLQPTGDRQLWLLSQQITKAGSGGRTLAELVDHVRQMMPAGGQRENFEDLVRRAGWRSRFAAGPLQRWRLRSEPALYRVADTFPRLTGDLMRAAGVDLSRITDIRYRLDLTGRSTDPAPEPLRIAVSAGRQELQ